MLQRMRFKDSLIIGMGIVPRGEVAMIVALIGLNQNLIDQGTYSVLIFNYDNTTPGNQKLVVQTVNKT